MEIYQRYVAKDGRMFDDALKCQEYEKTLGVLGGSVGELINELEKYAKPEEYERSIRAAAAEGNGHAIRLVKIWDEEKEKKQKQKTQ